MKVPGFTGELSLYRNAGPWRTEMSTGGLLLFPVAAALPPVGWGGPRWGSESPSGRPPMWFICRYGFCSGTGGPNGDDFGACRASGHCPSSWSSQCEFSADGSWACVDQLG